MLLLHQFQVAKDGPEGAVQESSSVDYSTGDLKVVTVDRPFIFAVQDRKNNVLVVVGKVTDPTKGYHIFSALLNISIYVP